MSDGMYLLLAATVAVLFVIVVPGVEPGGPNPHVDAAPGGGVVHRTDLKSNPYPKGIPQ